MVNKTNPFFFSIPKHKNDHYSIIPSHSNTFYHNVQSQFHLTCILLFLGR